MSDKSCESIADLLVDYADSELPDADAACVKAHLVDCLQCRAQLARLKRSLDLAVSLWRESADDARLPPAMPLRSTGRPSRAIMVLATCAAVLLAAVTLWLMWPEWSDEVAPPFVPRRSVAEVEEVLEVGQERKIVESPDEAEENGEAAPAEEPDFETIIARAGRRARLAVAAKFLATEPSLKSYKEDADRYLAAAYGDLSESSDGQL